MAKIYELDGKSWEFPDDVTDDEAFAFIKSELGEAPAAPPAPPPPAAPAKPIKDTLPRKLGRGVSSVVSPVVQSILNRATEGIEEITAPPQPGESLAGSALRGLVGGMKTMFPFTAPAGDAANYLATEAARHRKPLPVQRGPNPWAHVTTPRPEEPLASPEKVGELARAVTETGLGLIPGYTGLATVAQRGLRRGLGKAAAQTAAQTADLVKGGDAVADNLRAGLEPLTGRTLAEAETNIQAARQLSPEQTQELGRRIAAAQGQEAAKAMEAEALKAAQMEAEARAKQAPYTAVDPAKQAAAEIEAFNAAKRMEADLAARQTAAQNWDYEGIKAAKLENQALAEQAAKVNPPGDISVQAAKEGTLRDWQDTMYAGIDPTKVTWALRNPIARGTATGGVYAMTGEDVEDTAGKFLLGFGAGALSSKRGREFLMDSPVGRSIQKVYRHTLQTPLQMVKGIPAGESIVQSGIKAQAMERAIYHSMQQEIQQIFKGFKKPQIEEVNMVLDGVAQPTTPITAEAARLARQMLDNWATYNGIEPGKRLSEYFPHIRDEVYLKGKQIQIGPEKYIPKQIQETMDRRVAPFMLKTRMLDDPPMDYSLRPLDVYARATARNVALKGGETGVTGPITGFIKEVEPHLAGVPDKLADDLGVYINDMLGVPRGSMVLSHPSANALRTYQFGRLISGNLKTPIENLGQIFLNFVKSTPSSFTEGSINTIRNIAGRDPELRAFLNRNGISVAGVNKLEHLGRSLPQNAYENAIDKGSLPFRGSEYTNQSNAMFTGLPEAKLRGLVGREAEDFARRFTNDTQFNYGTSNLPAGWRAGTTGPLLTQMKQYALHYTNWVKDLVVNDAKQLVTGAPEAREAFSRLVQVAQTGNKLDTYRQLEHFVNSMPFAKTAKYFLVGSLLFGPEAMFGSLDKHLSEVMTGDPMKFRMEGVMGQGLIPSLGLYMGQMFGLGSLPAENFKTLAFFLPGPAASLFLDAVSLGATLASAAVLPVGKTFNISLDNFDIHEGIDWEAMVSKATRMLPFGVSLDRARKATVYGRSEDADVVRRPATLPQALGVDPVPMEARPIRTATPGSTFGVSNEVAKTILGFQTPDQHHEAELKREASKLQGKTQEIMRYAVEQAVVGGDISRGQEFLDKFNEAHGTNLVLTPESISSFLTNTQLDTPTRILRRSPKAARPRMLDLQKELFGD